MIFKNIFILMTQWMFCISCLTNVVYSQLNNYTFKQIICLGNKSEENIDDILIRPLWVTNDKLGQIYIMDKAILGIKKFDRHGNGLITIGSKGQGPREFRNIATMTFNLKNELVVVDNNNAKFALFKSNGDFISTYRLPLLKVPRPKRICCTPDSGYILLSVSSSNNYILHKFTKDFQYIKSFGELPIINDNEKEFEKAFARYIPGEINVDSQNIIYYVPGLYNGNIYVYKDSREVRVIKSKNISVNKPYEYEILPTNYTGPPKSGFQLIFANQLGRFGARRNLVSGGINIMDNGDIINLVISYQNYEKYEIGVEIFSNNGLKHDYFKVDNNKLLPAIWLSSVGRWYFIDYSKDSPVIKEFKFLIEKE